MDSTVVNKELRRVVRPTLKTHGFSESTARTFWRYGEERIDVVGFQSWNSYTADVIGITTFSFVLQLGIFLTFVPHVAPIARKDIRPKAFECDITRRLNAPTKPGEPDRQRNWYIEPDGSNVELVVQEALEAIERDAFDWFDRFKDLHEVKRTLLEDPGNVDEVDGIGNLPSPRRHFLTAHVALKLGDIDLARTSLESVIKSDLYFPGDPESLCAQLIKP